MRSWPGSVAGWDRDALIAAMAARGLLVRPVNDYDALVAHPQADGFLSRERSREGAEIIVPRPAIRAAGGRARSVPGRAGPGGGHRRRASGARRHGRGGRGLAVRRGLRMS
jgi:crotonobetainyl-CoA:carnitine CoA-transferase CaiB-like acyl-CoA transferase